MPVNMRRGIFAALTATAIYLYPGIAARIMQPTRPAIANGPFFEQGLFGLTPRRDCLFSLRPVSPFRRTLPGIGLCDSDPAAN